MKYSSKDVLSWLLWANQGATDEEKEARRLAIKKHLYPPGLGFVEMSMREFAEDKAEQIFESGTPPDYENWPEARAPEEDEIAPTEEPTPAQDPEPPAPLRERWTGFISSTSKAYRRGSFHDGTAQEIVRMTENAKGSPFDVGSKKRRS